MTKFDTMIRERKLQETEVAAINLVIKARARKYIAAANKDWLFPETLIHDPWAEVGKVLLPPEKGLWEFGGEIYVGGENGKLIHYQDEFGRSLGEMHHLKKELKREKIGRNDPCLCGSGKKYKKCCLDKPASERPSSTELSIRERNIILFRAVTDILGLAKRKTWLDVRKELSDETVREIHKVIGSLWPREANLMNLLPHPDSSILRALYAGIVDPRVILRNVVGFSLYFDEIIVLSPFTNPTYVKEEYSPVHSPSQFKQETIKNVLLFLQLAPFIQSGIVHMIPDPCDFDYHLREETWNMARERLKNWKPGKKEFKAMEPLFKDDFMRNMWSLPEESLKWQVKKALPDKSDKEIGLVLEYIKEMKTQDPLALLQPMQPGKEGGQLLITHVTPNLELGLFLAQVMGACIYTDSSHRWGELLGAMDHGSTSGDLGWELVANSLSNLHVNFLNQVDPQTTLAIRRSGKLGDFRKLLRQVWMNIQNNPEPERINALTEGFVDELKEVHAKAQAEWQIIQNELHRKIEDPVQRLLSIASGRIEFKIPLGGFGDSNVYRLLLTHSGRSDHLKYLPMAAFVSFDAN